MNRLCVEHGVNKCPACGLDSQTEVLAIATKEQAEQVLLALDTLIAGQKHLSDLIESNMIQDFVESRKKTWLQHYFDGTGTTWLHKILQR